MSDVTAMPGRLRRIYGAIAVVTLNTIVVIVALNALIWLGLRVVEQENPGDDSSVASSERDVWFAADGAPIDNGRRSPYQREWFDYQAYEGVVEPAYAATVLDDFWALGKLGFDYQPWVQFSEPPFDGELVHVDVDDRGFSLRRTVNPPHDAGVEVLTVFVLGGSTTFGYSVSDEHTWPSYLSRHLNEAARRIAPNLVVEVRNYGRGYYNPSQEAVLLLDLLKSGHRPDLVIFMDGVNWGPQQDVPHLTDEFGKRFLRAQGLIEGMGSSSRLERVPMVRLVRKLGVRRPAGNADPANVTLSEATANEQVQHIVNRFQAARLVSSAISGIYGVRPMFFLQPDAVYNYREQLYRSKVSGALVAQRKMRAAFHAFPGAKDGFIDLSGLFAAWGDARKAIVDDVHYSPNFNRFLATRVAEHIDLHQLLGAARRVGVHPGPTGAPRRSARPPVSPSGS